MGFRAADAVVATHAIINPVTGNNVTAGTPGVILKQVGSQPAIFRVRFGGTATGGDARPVVLDDVTDHDIAFPGADITEGGGLEFITTGWHRVSSKS